MSQMCEPFSYELCFKIVGDSPAPPPHPPHSTPPTHPRAPPSKRASKQILRDHTKNDSGEYDKSKNTKIQNVTNRFLRFSQKSKSIIDIPSLSLWITQQFARDYEAVPYRLPSLSLQITKPFPIDYSPFPYRLPSLFRIFYQACPY